MTLEATKTPRKKIERPCSKFLSGRDYDCQAGSDHCFNCARHLDGGSKCPKRCGEKGEAHDDAVLNDEEGS